MSAMVLFAKDEVPPVSQISQPSTVAKSRWRRIGVRRRRMAFVLLVLAGATGLAWLSMHRSRPVHYVTVNAPRDTNTRTAAATGTVDPVRTIVVGTYQRSLIT